MARKPEKSVYAFRRRCEKCGVEFGKHRKEGRIQFSQRRFCSRSCAMTGVSRSIAISPERIIENSMPIPFSGCWIWMAGDSAGYGKVTTARRTVSAHRASYVAFKGKVPGGLYVCHRCDEPGCVNPDHLFAGTPRDNMVDMAAKNRENPQRRFRPEDIALIRSTVGNTTSLAQAFGVSRTTIKNIRAQRSYRHVA